MALKEIYRGMQNAAEAIHENFTDLKNLFVGMTGNQTVLGTKDFQNGIKIKGKAIDDRMLKATISKTLGSELSEITSGSIIIYRTGSDIMFSCSFQLAKAWYKGTTFTNVGTDYAPAIVTRMNLTSDKMIYVEDSGNLKANSDFAAGDWITVTATWIAKNS